MSTSNTAISWQDIQRGLLDISVELSTQDLKSGSEFSIYVLVKNPYSLPIWIERVSVNTPSEIDLPELKKIQEKRINELEQITLDLKMINIEGEAAKVDYSVAQNLLEVYSSHLSSLTTNSSSDTPEKAEYAQKVAQEKENAKRAKEKLEKASAEFDVQREKGNALKEKILSNQLELNSPLPKDVALHPGDTAVYSIVFCTKSNHLFQPTQFKLHFNVVYHFGNPQEKRVNTAATDVSIRASLTSIMFGSLIGGFVGFLARQFQNLSFSDGLVRSWPSLLISLLLSLILSAISIVFIARKSERQSFVSIEDFWGGMLIGFLVGYSGTTAFQSVSGIS